MRFLLVFLFISLPCFGGNCEDVDIKLVGDIIFIVEGNEIQKFNNFPKNWNVNSDNFKSLYLKSKKPITEVEINLKSKTKKLMSKKYNLEKVKEKENLYKIKNILFRKDILSSYSLLPMEMSIKVRSQNNIKCEDKYLMEVIQ